ncbi:hypothetical protein [Actinomadura hibisca]|uniref:hypothetical protein n=1 Tax=Actinomadura hibisca TaxID=68565 RepID=UPI00082E4016|nr:hypothetical protein [Actinomadura hibisca]
MVGRRLPVTDRFRLSVLLEDGTDAERALREALEGLVVSALSAGVARRVLQTLALDPGGSES